MGASQNPGKFLRQAKKTGDAYVEDKGFET